MSYDSQVASTLRFIMELGFADWPDLVISRGSKKQPKTKTIANVFYRGEINP